MLVLAERRGGKEKKKEVLFGLDMTRIWRVWDIKRHERYIHRYLHLPRQDEGPKTSGQG